MADLPLQLRLYETVKCMKWVPLRKKTEVTLVRNSCVSRCTRPVLQEVQRTPVRWVTWRVNWLDACTVIYAITRKTKWPRLEFFPPCSHIECMELLSEIHLWMYISVWYLANTLHKWKAIISPVLRQGRLQPLQLLLLTQTFQQAGP